MNQWSDEQLMQLYFDGKLPAEDIPEVERRICCESALADQLLKISGDEINLLEWEGDFLKYSTGQTGWEQLCQYTSKHSRKATFSLLGVLACVGLFSSFYFFNQKPPATSLPSLVESQGHQKKLVKERRKQQTITEGTVEFLLPSGVKVMVTAPATFQITGKNEIKLSRGMLIAEVLTEEGKGFTVSTPSSINIDLGTVFGIAVDQKGTSVTQVFQGVVTSTNPHFLKENTSLPRTFKLTSNERLLHRTDGTSTQKIKNLAELFFAKFDHPSSSSNKTGMKYRVAKLIGIDKNRVENLRQKQRGRPASIAEILSLDDEVLLSKKSANEADSTTSFYNSFDNELAIEMGGAIKNAKSGPQYANLTYEEGGVLIKEGSRLSFATAGRLNNKKGHISFRIKPNWDGDTDKQARLFVSSGPFMIGKWYGFSRRDPKSYLVFKFHQKNGIRIETNSFYGEPKIVESWKKGTWHTVEAEWDLTLPPGQQYITLRSDDSSVRTKTGTWHLVEPLDSTVTIGTDHDFQLSADAVFDDIQISNEPKGNKK